MQEKMQTTEQKEKQQKFLLLLPLLVLPFMVLFFWAFGGGKGDKSPQTAQQKGINTELPSAQFKGEKQQDKLSLYNQAAKDSANEKNRSVNPLFETAQKAAGHPGQTVPNSAEASEAQINQKLAQLNQQLNAPPQPPTLPAKTNLPPAINTAEVDRLEKMMKTMQGQNTEDPEMKQLSGMVDKILQLQHPELVAEKLKKETPAKPDSMFKAIPALVDGNQKVLQGGIVRLRLADSIYLNGTRLPRGFKLFGNCVITNQRLLLTIKNITLGNTIVPVDLTVFSRDGIPGINAPEAELSEAAGNGTNDALSGMEFLPMDETLGTQAASAGINAAKGLIGKKVRKIRVKLKGDYPVLLRNNH